MSNKPVAYINVEERKLEWSKPMAWHTPTIAQMDKIPLYTHPAKPIDKPDECIDGCPKNQTCDYCAGIKTLTDEEIIEIGNAVTNLIDSNEGWIEFARAILKKASEK